MHFVPALGFEPVPRFLLSKKLEEEGLILLSESFTALRVPTYSPARRGYMEFQVANEKFDAVIKALLRVHGSELYGICPHR